MLAFEKLFSKKPPPILYHYTSLAAFNSIMSTKKLWATHVRYLNDCSELDHALHHAIEFTTQVLGRSGVSGVILDALNKMLNSMLSRLEKRLAFCTCSFSELGDSLSQWRGYCPNGLGVSIGFDSAIFDRTVGDVSRCVYNDAEKRELIEKILADVCREELITGKLPIDEVRETGHFRDHVEAAIDDWGEKVVPAMVKFCEVAPIFKDAAFCDEREWRYVTTQETGDSPDLPKWRFRTNGSTLVPYIELDFTANGPLHLKEILLSPNPHPERLVQAIELCLASNDVVCDNIRVSKIPFRNW